MAFVPQKRHRTPGRFLRVKVWLFSAGAILLLVGMARNLDLLVFAAIAVLAIAFVLRFFERDEDDDAYNEEEDAGEEDFANEEPMDDEAARSSQTEDDPSIPDRRQPIE